MKELIPETVHVSIFEVHLKETLAILEERYQQLSKNLVDVIAKRAKDASIKLFNQIMDMKTKVMEEPQDIEKLTQLKEYMVNMPQSLEVMKIQMNSCFDIYKMLEGFNYRFSKDEMSRRWNIFAAPREIL